MMLTIAQNMPPVFGLVIGIEGFADAKRHGGSYECFSNSKNRASRWTYDLS